MAYHRQAGYSYKHHIAAPATKIARVEPGREHLAVHARQLAIQQDLQLF